MAEIDEIIKAVYEAGKLMKSSSHSITKDKGTKENYATEADLKVEAFFKEELTKIVPGSKFIGEEGDVSKGEYTWVVDPIDGTVNFARGIPLSVISVALVHDDEVIAGAVYNPYYDEMYHAVKGSGAYLNGERIHVSDRDKNHSIVCLAWSVYEKKWSDMCFDITTELYKECEDIRRLGSAAYEMCLIAKGSAEMLFEMRLFPWDYAAASLILSEAGGCTTSIDGPLDLYDQCTTMAANNRENLEYLRDIVKRTMGDFRITGSIWG